MRMPVRKIASINFEIKIIEANPNQIPIEPKRHGVDAKRGRLVC